jgi:CCR4-NOT transcriptional regulation complex NOT5 subunit
MSTKKLTSIAIENPLEERKVKALEKIANCLDSLSLWVEEIDKDEWGERIEYYLAEFHKVVPKEE